MIPHITKTVEVTPECCCPNCKIILKEKLEYTYLGFKACLFDTEIEVQATEKIHFFQRPLGSSFRDTTSPSYKDEHCTNLQQPCMLSYPQQFDATHVGVFCDNENPAAFTDDVFFLTKCGRTPVFQASLSNFDSEREVSAHYEQFNEIVETLSQGQLFPDQNGTRYVPNNALDLKLLIPIGQTVHIDPGEAFQASIERHALQHAGHRWVVALFGTWWFPKD